MSLASVTLEKRSETNSHATYAVLSPDFSSGIPQEIARVVIDKEKLSYEFELTGMWVKEKVVPPFVYGLEEVERDRLLKERYLDHSYGAWTGRVFSKVAKMLVARAYPDLT
jgi:hypothetical protein